MFAIVPSNAIPLTEKFGVLLYSVGISSERFNEVDFVVVFKVLFFSPRASTQLSITVLAVVSCISSSLQKAIMPVVPVIIENDRFVVRSKFR
ncbi:MAG: hypothetical protein U0103_05770 [Candidatus Obscuribacterales bacterium]